MDRGGTLPGRNSTPPPRSSTHAAEQQPYTPDHIQLNINCVASDPEPYKKPQPMDSNKNKALTSPILPTTNATRSPLTQHNLYITIDYYVY